MIRQIFPTTMLFLTTLCLSAAPLAVRATGYSQIQDISWSTENLGTVVNSPYHDAFPSISRDGLVLYFASDRASYTNVDDAPRIWRITDFDIYVTRRKNLNASWEVPKRLPPHINTPSIEHSISISPDRHWLYFSSNRPGGCGMLDIYRAYRDDINDDLAWGKPENLGCELNSPETDVCVIYYYDEDKKATSLFFVSNRAGTSGSLDVFESKQNPETHVFEYPDVVESLNSTAFDGHFDPEAGYLWTQREGGFGGSDIWLTRRLDSGDWANPVNLGPAINTEFEEQMPSPFDHGRVLYFPSDRPGGHGGLDIYVSKQL